MSKKREKLLTNSNKKEKKNLGKSLIKREFSSDIISFQTLLSLIQINWRFFFQWKESIIIIRVIEENVKSKSKGL